jgi:hypothetical protein
MLDPATYAAGAEAGFSGIDFYAAGRGGALGDVDAATVAEAFAFFEPGVVKANWESGTAVLPPRACAERFMAVGHQWATAHLRADGCDWARLAELLGRVADADTVGAPLVAGWRSMPEPGGDDPRPLALQRLNVAREQRFAAHAAAVADQGLTPVEAMSVRTPYMLALFGWGEPAEVTDELRARWEAAEAATNRALAPAYATLDEGERAELVALCQAALASVE